MTRKSVRPLHALAVAVLLSLHAWLAISATRQKSPTFDEPFHMLGGYSYQSAGDFRLHPENGVLPQRVAGAALGTLAPTLPRDGYDEAWRTSDIATLGDAFLYGVGNNHREMLVRARRAALLWSVVLGLVVFAWAWTLWGPAGAFFALGMYSISPTMLAHGPLVTSDTSAALFLALATWAWWRHLERPTVGSLLLSALSAGLAAIAKFSAAVLPPVFIMLAAWKLLASPTWTLHLPRPRELRGMLPRLSWIAGAIVVHTLVAALMIWAAFDFRFSAVGSDMPPMAQYYRLWSDALPSEGLMRSAILALREWQLLPEAYIYGFSFVLRFAESRPAFLNGEFGSSGWWWFFPYAFVVKSTIAELVALVTTVGLSLVAWRKRIREPGTGLSPAAHGMVPIVALAATYLAVSLSSSLNIGHRHLLPIYPLLFVASGALVLPSAARWRRWMAAALLAVGALESFTVRPHYLAFFNASVGGPALGWRHLVDSSLDWGQDVPALVDWVAAERRPGEALYYSVFGQRHAEAFGLQGTEIAPGYSTQSRPWIEWGPGIYAISATNLQDVYSPFAGPWDQKLEVEFQMLLRKKRAERERDPSTAVIGSSPEMGENYWTLERLQFARLVNYLRVRRPEATLGYSIFVHRLSSDEARVLREGLPKDYLALLDSVLVR